MVRVWFAYPAPGSRSNGSGVLLAVGNSGNGWSSSITDHMTYFLDSHYDWIRPNNFSSRAHGLQLRCLQE
ncbi:MAG: hypothetical protein K2K83_02845 [Rikenella sp.]|nr:hypothetical protein [Rikenella sp.]